jgi:ssRNA-specific RNase YbeY (16S rRNA maturation enzyme)
MEKTTVSVWWALQGALPNVWHLTDEEIQLQDSIDEITFFVEKLQKYAMAELYMFMREQNCSDEFIQEVTEYFDSDKFTGVVLFTNQPERRTSWYSSWALWTASVKNWNSSIALNLSLISESLWNESKNESKSLYDAITDVYLHEFFHIVDYSKKWDQEDDFDKVKFNEVSLEEVMTEICSTYLEWLWNEKELKDITKLWERKWINSISFLQFLNEWYEVWSDNYELLEFFEGARKEWKLWYMLEILVNWSIDDCKKLIDEVFKHSDPKKTWRDIIPWLQ